MGIGDPSDVSKKYISGRTSGYGYDRWNHTPVLRTNFFELEYICPPNGTAVLKAFYIIFPSQHSHSPSVQVPERRGQLIVYPPCLRSHLAIIGDTGPRAPHVIVEVRHLSRRVCLSRSYVFEIPLLSMGRGGPCRCCCYGLDILYRLVEGI